MTRGAAPLSMRGDCLTPTSPGAPAVRYARGMRASSRRVAAVTALFALAFACSCGDDRESGISSSSGTTGNGGAGTTGAGGDAGSGSGAGGATGSGGGGGAPPVTCGPDDCHYVRADAQGAADGTSWTDAWPVLPGGLAAGHVYFVAAGVYPALTLADAGSAGAPVRVLRATDADHGSAPDYDPAYGAGTAELGPVAITAPYVELDGRGATRIVGAFQGAVASVDAPNATLAGCEIDGNFQVDGGGVHVDGACTGIEAHGDGVVVRDNVVHDVADDGIVASDSSGMSFEGNRVHALHGCGTDGGCGPCYNGHSDGFEVFHLTSSQFVGNMVWDVASTSAFFFGNWADELGNGPADYCKDLLLANNILYSYDTGFVAYIEDVDGVEVYDNVFWGQHQGAYGGLSIGTNVTGLSLYNNVVLSINYTHIGGSYDPVEHVGDYNAFGLALGQWPTQPHDVVASDPGFAGIPDVDGALVPSPAPQDFAPAPGSPLRDAGYPGDATVAIPALDFFGTPRDATPAIGAIEP